MNHHIVTKYFGTVLLKSMKVVLFIQNSALGVFKVLSHITIMDEEM